METIITIVLIALAIAIITAFSQAGKTPVATTKVPTPYRYQVKNKIMTEREVIFYGKLTSVAGDKYAVIPQVHLSAFLDHKLKGQNWKGAFSVINGKSVDFLLVDKTTLAPSIAIELDDYSHQQAARIERDRRVEDILHAANMKLIRFTDVNISEEQMINRLSTT